MAQNSSIEWTEATWNPVTGCTRVSSGCDHCYAVKQTYRLERMGQIEKYGGTLAGEAMRRSVKTETPDTIALIQFIGQRIEEGFRRHRLMKGGIKYGDVRKFRKDPLGFANLEQAARIV